MYPFLLWPTLQTHRFLSPAFNCWWEPPTGNNQLLSHRSINLSVPRTRFICFMLIRAWLCSGLCSWAEEIWLTPVAARSTQASGLLAQMCARSGWRQGTVTTPPPPNLALTTTTPLYWNFALDHLPEAQPLLTEHTEVPGDAHSEWDHCILFLLWRLFDVAEDAKLHLRC